MLMRMGLASLPFRWINLDIYRLLNMPVPWEAGSSELAAEAGQVRVGPSRYRGRVQGEKIEERQGERKTKGNKGTKRTFLGGRDGGLSS